MTRKVLLMPLVILAAIFIQCACTPESEAIEGVQLWDGGPFWATANLTAGNGSHQLTFDEAMAAEGLGWRVPTEDDYLALKQNCDWMWIQDGQRTGFEVAGPTGARIFFPAEGYASRNITMKHDGVLGFYWTSSAAASGKAREVYMDENYAGINDRGRDNGLSVRMVCDNYSPVMAQVDPCMSYTGRGNKGETLFTISLTGRGRFRLDPLNITVDAPEGTVDKITLICDGKVLASSAVTGRLTFAINRKFRGSATLEVRADIAEDAAEGSVVNASLEGVSCDGSNVPVVGGRIAEREVLLARKCLYRPGDYGSNFWRIPTIRQLSDGTLLTVNDRRNDTEEDLPGRIDVVYRYSTDGGRTWSEPGFIAKNGGYLHGYGDPSLVECEDGTVVCMFCGGQTYSMSNIEDPQRTYYALSHDHGRTWDEPVQVTSQMWGPDAKNPYCRAALSTFFSSGNSLILKSGPHKGRILVASVTHYPDIDGFRNHAVWSDDNGRTWNVSDVAFNNGDEAKMVELSDGRVLMSIRQSGDRAFSISEDGGETWSETGVWPEMHVTACNGDLIRYNADILLHTVPDSMKRENVTVFVSYDDAATWPYRKCICHGPSQYSSITVLPDGTIGAYIEEQTKGTQLWFENFSLDWLLKGR